MLPTLLSSSLPPSILAMAAAFLLSYSRCQSDGLLSLSTVTCFINLDTCERTEMNDGARRAPPLGTFVFLLLTLLFLSSSSCLFFNCLLDIGGRPLWPASSVLTEGEDKGKEDISYR